MSSRLPRIHGSRRRHAQVDRNLTAEVASGTWKTPQDVKTRYVAASFLPDNVVIFNVKGNEYRLEVFVADRTATVIVRWIGSHAEYDQRNKRR
ncbi:MAG TPA: type II toxin-antitoxin system HigB family toxin [Burkholderiales bacterium]|nr:type II toxin-antitoxin system HigB family toxin [Burkholderiales bacterium]